MNTRMIAHILGRVLLILAALLLFPLLTAVAAGEDLRPFLLTMIAAALPGSLLLLSHPRSRLIYAREGLTIVGLAWAMMSLLGAIPFVLSGDIPNYVDAVFETVSGLTTTGATILSDMESVSRSGMFWRCFTHWIGGMGVLVFIMAVLPMNGAHSTHIMRAEVPGPIAGKVVPRARRTAFILYSIYAGLTVAETGFLMAGGMNFYEALLHAFASAGTGGFSTRSTSIAAFHSAYIETVIGFFLILFAANFNLFYLILIGKWKEAFKSEELRWYLAILLISVVSITVGIAPLYGSVGTGLRHAFFNVTSVMSTTGFGIEDFTLWPSYTQALLVLLMFIGGCAGSTGGGLKVSRVILLFKTAASDIRQVIRPRSINQVRLDGKRVTSETTRAVYTYTSLYMLILILCTLLVSFNGFDFTTSFTASLACLSNVGPGLARVGPAGNYSIFTCFTKIVLSLVMLLGRLEIYAVLILFIPSTWKQR